MSDTDTEAAVTPTVDLHACNGHGRCYMTAPDVFDCDDDGFPVVLGPAGTGAQRAQLQRAVSNCPEQAITTSSDPAAPADAASDD